MLPPHIRTAENSDWIFSQPVPPASSTTVRVKVADSAKACQTLMPNSSVDATISAATVARPISTSGLRLGSGVFGFVGMRTQVWREGDRVPGPAPVTAWVTYVRREEGR